ncbi:MASE1 domain-containing protein [uncultured Erythrobacter sp.]|uniref:sensor histidine kinase n=1 Tax=uncultured Erythrobacter sp. TaxID=263913 RepID=UPI00265873F8|nr:MASE1 domain-containing protein [uncultured Erythrobacter sp.]
MMRTASPKPFLWVELESERSARTSETLTLNCVVALAYFLTGKAGLQLAFVGDVVTLFWPPSGIAFAALWLGGHRMIWGVIAGAFAVNALLMDQLQFAALVALGNSLPALVATMVLREQIRKRGETLGELWRVLMFILVAALGTTTISATIGTLAVAASQTDPNTTTSAWLVWWMGDAMGVLIIGTPILLWDRYLRKAPVLKDVFDGAAFGMAGLGIIAGLLLIDNPIWAVELCKLFTLLLSLWAGARFGLAGPAAITLLMAIGGVTVTLLDAGPFKRDNFYDSFALLHSYLFAEAIAGMLLAAALADLRRTVRAERVARSAAENAAAERVRLLTMISHDVRTPLAGMMGVLQQFRREAASPEQGNLAALGLRAGQVLNTLVTDILDVARIDSGRIVLVAEPFNPAQSIADIISFASEDARGKGLALEVIGLEALPDLIVGDRARFEQVVGNLVTNAVNYTPAGSVKVTAGWHTNAACPLVIEVQDTGPGIAPERIPQLFEAFVLGPDPGRSSAGLGLGLHICRQLTALMGGSIGYQSPASGGSLFRVELALAVCDVPLTKPAAAFDPPRQILLVEDDAIASSVTQSLLASFGHDVTAVSNTAIALQALAAGSYDLVLLDIGIDGDREGGLLTVRRICKLANDRSKLTIVALTANALIEDHLRFFAAGFDAVLVKPLSLEQGLAAQIEEAQRAAKRHVG